jgi:hypothetical protein
MYNIHYNKMLVVYFYSKYTVFKLNFNIFISVIDLHLINKINNNKKINYNQKL